MLVSIMISLFQRAYTITLFRTTVQLSSMATFACILDAYCMCFRHISHMFHMHLRQVKKGRGTHVCLAAAISRGFALARMCLVRVPDMY